MSVRNLLAGKMQLVATLPDHLRVHVMKASKGTAFNVQVIPMPCMHKLCCVGYMSMSGRVIFPLVCLLLEKS